MNEILDGIHAAIQQVAQSATPPEPARGDDSGLRRELAATERRLRDSLRGMRSVKERSRPAPFVMPVQSDAEKRKSIELVLAALRCRKGRYLSAAQMEMVGNCGGPGSGKPGPCPDPLRDLEGAERLYVDMGHWINDRLRSGKPLTDPDSPDEDLGPVVRDLDNAMESISEPRTVYRGMSIRHIPEVGGMFTDRGYFSTSRKKSIALKFKRPGDGGATVDIELPKGAKVLDLKSKTEAETLLARGTKFKVVSKQKLTVGWRVKLEVVGSEPTANASPVVVSRLAPYLHELLGDVTKKQSRVIAQALKRGIDRKWADSTVARLIADKADIDPDRAKVIARTEMRRAKADIQLGKKRDSAKVVFTLGNEDACPICRALDGKVFTVRKAQGVIPVHPNCYCFWSDAAKGAKVTRNEVAPITNDFRDSLLRFSALNQFCATGEGGGIDPSCPSTGDKPSAPIGAEGTQIAPSKVSPKRAKQVLADADKLKVDDDLVHGKGDIDVDDLDAIEELLTGNEKRKLESYVESAQELYVDSQMEDFEPEEFNEDRWARSEGYDPNSIRKDALTRLQDWSNEDGISRLTDAINEWHSSTDVTGVEAMDELRNVLEDNDAPQFLKDDFDEKYSEAEDRHQEALDGFSSVEDQEAEARSQLADGFDARESREEFLRQFVEENSDDPRFGGGKRTYDTWGKSAEDNGDNQLFFQTSKGNEYEVWDNEQAMGQGGVPLRYREIGFNDASGDFGVTGAGNAVEVFGKASAAVVKLLKEKDYDVASFTAAEPSRQRLYDRLVRTVSSVMPDYAAFSYQSDPGSPRRYVVAKKTKADQIRAEFAKLPNGKVDVLANADTPQLVPLTPEVREDWFTDKGWPEAGTGEN